MRTPTIIIEPRRGLFDIDLGGLWQYRELFYFLIWRDIKVRYKQTLIGAAWAVVQPLVTMTILAVIFGRFVKVPSENLPYPIFVFAAILPWNFFAGALTRSTASLVSSAHLVSKVYFPRTIVPVSASLSGVIEFAIAFLILLAMMVWYGFSPTQGAWFLPLFLLMALLTALAVGMWLSALNVKYRDVGYIVPILIQLWMYASPIIYPVSLVPERWRMFYRLNPMANVIEGFRWALLGKQSPDFLIVTISATIALVILAGGILYFKSVERTFADVV